MSSNRRVYLFAGDSLTEGVYGANYVDRVAAGLANGEGGLEDEVVNAGRSGETVASLLHRVDRLIESHRPTWLILAVGCNDVWLPWLSDHSLGWRLWLGYRRLRTRQESTRDLDQFAAAYRAVIDRAQRAGVRALACTTSPVGEQLSSGINGRVARLNGVIKHVAADRRVPVADVWQAFIEELALLSKPSTYLSAEWLLAWLDRRRYRGAGADAMAERRRLHLTFDGLHLNSRGADLWATVILRALASAESREGRPPSEPRQADLQSRDDLRTRGGARAVDGQAVRSPLRAPEANLPPLVRGLDLGCLQRGLLPVCYSPGREARAQDVGQLLAAVYDDLSSLMDVCPPVYVAVLSSVHRGQSTCPVAHPAASAVWDGDSGALFVADAYDLPFLRRLHLPEAVASWAPDLAEVGELAQATALADLLAVEELARLFLLKLRVVPTDPELARLLAAYLTLVVLQRSRAPGSAGMADLWIAWGQILAEAGVAEGQIRLQARALYAEHGEHLVAWITGAQPVTREAFQVPPAETSGAPAWKAHEG